MRAVSASFPRTPLAAAHGGRSASGFTSPGVDPLRFALMAMLLFSVGRVQEAVPALMPLRVGLLATGIALMLTVVQPGVLAPGGLLRTWPAKVMVGLIVLACIGAPFGISLGNSAKHLLERFSKVMVFALLLVGAIRGARDLRWFVWGYVAAAAYLCYRAIFVAEVSASFSSAVARLDGEAFGAYDANDLGLVLCIAIPFALLTLQTSGRKGKAFCLLLLIGIGITIAISGSRGAFLGLLAVGLALLVFLTHIAIATRVGAIVFVAVTLAVMAPAGYWEQMRTILDTEGDYNKTAEDGRLAVWSRGIGYMATYPVFGVGLGNFGRAEGYISSKARDHVPGTGLRFTAPHNSFVEVGAELGLPGLALWSSLVIGGIAAMRRLRRRMPREWLHGDPEQRFLYLMTAYLPVAFIGFAVTGSFVSFAFMPPVFILAAFVAGMYVSVDRRLAWDQACALGGMPLAVPAGPWGRRGRGRWARA